MLTVIYISIPFLYWIFEQTQNKGQMFLGQTTRPITKFGILPVILKGVSPGDNVVIGADSVVTKDVSAGEIWVGNPIKKFKIME